MTTLAAPSRDGAAERWPGMKNTGRFWEYCFNAFPEGILVFDSGFRMASANECALELTGMKGEEEHPAYAELFPEAPVMDASLLRNMDSGTVIEHIVTPLRRRSGEKIPVAARFISIHAERDEPCLLCVLLPACDTGAWASAGAPANLKRFGIVSRSKSFAHIQRVIGDIARSSAPVLIFGESGTGKELLANSIHQLSERSRAPMVKINCGAIPETLLEAELFGYKKGAFTDARTDKAGRFKLAEGGTIFLDQIGDISAQMQVKLLRVLDKQEYDPLGSVRTEHTDVRVVAATHKDLWEMVKNRQFRHDLFFRLNVMSITIPPLRERLEDIPLLADLYIRSHCEQVRGKAPSLSPEVLQILYEHSFPGNIRELHNILEHALVLCRGAVITTEHLPSYIFKAIKLEDPIPEGSLRAQEEASIRRAMLEFGGNAARAASFLGIHVTTLRRKARKMGLFPWRG